MLCSGQPGGYLRAGSARTFLCALGRVAKQPDRMLIKTTSKLGPVSALTALRLFSIEISLQNSEPSDVLICQSNEVLSGALRAGLWHPLCMLIL